MFTAVLFHAGVKFPRVSLVVLYLLGGCALCSPFYCNIIVLVTLLLIRSPFFTASFCCPHGYGT
jgi:hypothetical protein